MRKILRFNEEPSENTIFSNMYAQTKPIQNCYLFWKFAALFIRYFRSTWDFCGKKEANTLPLRAIRCETRKTMKVLLHRKLVLLLMSKIFFQNNLIGLILNWSNVIWSQFDTNTCVDTSWNHFKWSIINYQFNNKSVWMLFGGKIW